MVFPSSSTAEPHLGRKSISEDTEEPASSPRPLVPMKLPKGEPCAPAIQPVPPPFSVAKYPDFPGDEITRQIQLLC